MLNSRLQLVLVSFILTSVSPVAALALGPVYVETGAGVALIQGGQSFFKTTTGGTMSLGAALNLAIGVSLTGASRSGQVQLALQHRLSNGSKEGRHFGLQATYPILRLEAAGFFVGGGATPLVWSRVGDTAGFDNYAMPTGAVGLLGEVGYHYVITPEVSIGLSAAGQGVLIGGEISPKPSMEASVLFRFFFDKKRSPDKEPEGPYRGWRYPYGIELN